MTAPSEKMQKIHIKILLFICFSAIPLTAHASPAKAEVTVETQGKAYSFQAEIAETPHQQQQGLMGRRHLKANEGMLFVLQEPKPVKMWMKDTPIPLDMLFADTTGKIIHIEADAKPQTLDARGPDVPVATVFEIAGGTAAHYRIRPGDVLTYRLKGSTP